MTPGGSIVTALLVSCGVCCCCCYFFPKDKKEELKRQFSTRNVGGAIYKNASEQEYHEAVAFQSKNVPTASPPDFFTGNPRMIVDAAAKKSIEQSISINDEGNKVQFLDKSNVEDRCVVSNIRIKYFEVTITNKPKYDTCIAVGICSKPYPPMRFPGWHEHSVGYHSDNGNKFFNDDGDGNSYASQYSNGDTIGSGFVENSDGSQSFFFTKNGTHLGTAFTTHKLRGETFACIGGDGNCALTINFGKDPSNPLQWSDPQEEGKNQKNEVTTLLGGNDRPASSSTYSAPPAPVQNTSGPVPYQASVQNTSPVPAPVQNTSEPVPYQAPVQNASPVPAPGPIQYQAPNQQSEFTAPVQYQAPNQQSGFAPPPG